MEGATQSQEPPTTLDGTGTIRLRHLYTFKETDKNCFTVPCIGMYVVGAGVIFNNDIKDVTLNTDKVGKRFLILYCGA
jgi:hypothetical protein